MSMSKPPGPIVLGILAHITEFGPATRAELCRALGRDREAVASVVSRLARAGRTVPKRIRIVDYVYEDEAGRRYPRALYDLGDGPDEVKPKPDTAANSARYLQRNRTQVASVFDLGRPGRARKALVTL